MSVCECVCECGEGALEGRCGCAGWGYGGLGALVRVCVCTCPCHVSECGCVSEAQPGERRREVQERRQGTCDPLVLSSLEEGQGGGCSSGRTGDWNFPRCFYFSFQPQH